jgi:two-component system nitrate/nitrite sensor histidine kinase NarQ
VAREAILNAQNHANASHIRVSFTRDDEHYMLYVVDDGQGFDPVSQANDRAGHFGLQIMHARATRLGGELLLQSAPAQGTRVILSWPVNTNSKL